MQAGLRFEEPVERRAQRGARDAAEALVARVTASERELAARIAADVVAAPLRIARGIQNKVLEAMAMARPVVASPAAFEGIEAEPGSTLPVFFQSGDAEGVNSNVPVLDGQLDYLSTLVPTPSSTR